MSKMKLLIVNNEVVAYTDNKSMIKAFVHQHEVSNYKVKKTTFLPEGYELEIYHKKLYEYGDHYGSDNKPIVISDYLLEVVESHIDEMRVRLDGVDKWLIEFEKYIKLDSKEEEALVSSLSEFFRHFIASITPDNDYEVYGINYGDFAQFLSILKRYLNE